MSAKPPDSTVIRFGTFEADRQSRELRKQGQRIRLPIQSFQVLSMLLERPGTVVTREELQKALWPGSVVVDFDHGLNNAIARLREALGDNAGSAVFVETLPRLGYRFIHPLSGDPPDRGEPEPSAEDAAAESPARTSVKRWAIAGGLLLVVLAAGLWAGLRAGKSAAPPTAQARQTVAVLPLKSLSDDPADAYFTAGLSEELLSQLSRVPNLGVAGQVSSFRYGNSKETPAQIARALGVDHLLMGSVRRSGERVRVTAQLMDARSGMQLWSQSFERELGDIFRIQDEIALAVTSSLRVRLEGSTASKYGRPGTRNPEAYRLYLMGVAQFRGLGSLPDREVARQRFEQAIALDPEFAEARAGLASYYFNGAAVDVMSPEEGAERGLAEARRAFALNPESSEALRVMANFEMWQYRFRGDSAAYSRSVALFRRAVAVDPANSFAYFDYGRAIQWTEPRRAVQLFKRAAELDPLAPISVGLGALALSRLGEHDAARTQMDDYVARMGESLSSVVVAAYEASQGNLDRSAVALAKVPASPRTGIHYMNWGVLLSLGDRAGAQEALQAAGDAPITRALRTAADLGMQGRYQQAFESLDRARHEFPVSHVLDLPCARFALIAGQYSRAREILEERLPDLAEGSEPITTPRVIPALDLVLAWQKTGNLAAAGRLLERVKAALSGPDHPAMPLFDVQLARAHALEGETDLAIQTLALASAHGFAQTCALDMQPHPLFYVDCMDVDPTFAVVRGDPRYQAWWREIAGRNRDSLARLETQQSTAL